jgi:hypothetical protein
MSKPFNSTDLTLSTTSSADDLFTTSVNYVKKQTSTLSWEQIIIICLVVLLVFVFVNNRSKNRVIRRQKDELRRQSFEIQRSRSISKRLSQVYDEQ